MFIPFFFPIVDTKEKLVVVHLDKHHFIDTDGYKKIRWGNETDAMTTFEDADEWANLIIDNMKKTLLIPPSPEDKEIK